jgi:hypothetical protein
MKTLLRVASNTNTLLGGGERGKDNRLEQSESQRLEALAGSMGL